ITSHFQSTAARRSRCESTSRRGGPWRPPDATPRSANGPTPPAVSGVVMTVLMPVTVRVIVLRVVVTAPMVVMVVMMMIVVVVAPVVVMMVGGVRHGRIGAEDERLDRHRNGERRHPHAAEIDVVEVPQGNAVQYQHLRGNRQLVFQDRSERLRDVAVH